MNRSCLGTPHHKKVAKSVGYSGADLKGPSIYALSARNWCIWAICTLGEVLVPHHHHRHQRAHRTHGQSPGSTHGPAATGYTRHTD